MWRHLAKDQKSKSFLFDFFRNSPIQNSSFDTFGVRTFQEFKFLKSLRVNLGLVKWNKSNFYFIY